MLSYKTFPGFKAFPASLNLPSSSRSKQGVKRVNKPNLVEHYFVCCTPLGLFLGLMCSPTKVAYHNASLTRRKYSQISAAGLELRTKDDQLER